MPHRDDTRLDARKLLPRAGRPKRRDQPEPVPVLDVVEERPAMGRRGAFLVLIAVFNARRKGAVAAQVLR